MARETKRSGVERFKYGICLNDECSKCKSKEVQHIAMRKEFICEECGKELRECPPPKQANKLSMIIIAAIVVLAVLGGGLFSFLGGSSNEEIPVEPVVADTASVTAPEISVKSDTVVVRDTIVQNNTTTISEKTSTKTVVSETTTKSAAAKHAKSTSASGSLNLGYAKFAGPVKNGQPNGLGRMTFSSSHQIDYRDPKERIAEVGDYVIGEWSDGKLVQGRWFGPDNTVKGSIIIGM